MNTMKKIIPIAFIILGTFVSVYLAYGEYEKATPTPKPTPKATGTPDTKTAEKSAKPTPKPRTSLVRSAPIETKARPDSISMSSRAKSVSPRISMKVDTDRPVLMIITNDVPIAGKTFKTDVYLSNPKSVPLNAISLALTYNPVFLRPQKKDHEEIEKYGLEPEGTFTLKRNGTLIYSFSLTRSTNVSWLRVMSIEWEALKDTSETIIGFTFKEEAKTFVTYNGNDVLGNPKEPNDGFIPLTIPILKVWEEEEDEFFEHLIASDALLSSLVPDKGVRLSLVKPDSTITAGDTFTVSIYFNNAAQAPSDSINLVIGFDPKILRVVDNDTDGWITRGINIFDGAYQEAFPFDYHIRNDADNVHGKIVYKMGISREDALYTRSEMAQITFNALKPAEETWVWFMMPENKLEKGTRVSYMGMDVLGIPGDLSDGITNLSLSIKEMK